METKKVTKILYLLGESSVDETFYEGVAERITGYSFRRREIRVRPNAGYPAVCAATRLFLQSLVRLAAEGEIFFILAVDNDRVPHPWDAEDRGIVREGESRYERFERELADGLGKDRAAWPVKGALAIPVEMLESWILLATGEKEEADLPRFSRARSVIAREFYAPSPPPPQLKDLVKEKRYAAGYWHNEEFFLDCAHRLDPDKLAAKSPSFAYFYAQVKDWKGPR